MKVRIVVDVDIDLDAWEEVYGAIYDGRRAAPIRRDVKEKCRYDVLESLNSAGVLAE